MLEERVHTETDWNNLTELWQYTVYWLDMHLGVVQGTFVR